MSLVLPRLIDDLEGRVPRSSLLCIPGTTEEQKREFCTLARQAEKFNFGELLLEANPDKIINGRPTWHAPELTPVEIEAWDAGLIPLPAPVCWLEFKLGDSVTGFLVKGTAGQIDVQRVDYTKDSEAKIFTGTWSVFHGKEANKEDVVYAAVGNETQMRFLKNFYAAKGDTGVLNPAQDHYLAVYLVLMISSLSTEIKRETTPTKLNRARVKSGHEPLPNHYVVTIVPGRFRERTEAQGGTHNSPRLHWRRSHLRHFEHQTGNAKWLASETYKGTTGWWVTMIPRCLIGVAELGEVSHEYKVGVGK